MPASVFLKLPAGAPVIRLFGNLARLGENEVRFYREVRPSLDLVAPTLLGSAFEDRTKRYALVLDDLVAAGATFADATTSLEPAQTLLVLENLARLHGALLDVRRSSTPISGGSTRTATTRCSPRSPGRCAGCRPGSPRDARELIPDAGRAILDAYPDVARRLDDGPHTILHGDPHPGNCYFVGGRAGLLDWQVLRRGHPMRDVAYHLVLALDRETRRSVERDLLRRYCEALAAHGGPSFDDDTAWTTYRRMAAAPSWRPRSRWAWPASSGTTSPVPGSRRAAAAIVDLGTAAALGLDPSDIPPGGGG